MGGGGWVSLAREPIGDLDGGSQERREARQSTEARLAAPYILRYGEGLKDAPGL